MRAQRGRHPRRSWSRFLDFSGENAALLIDNHDWLGGLGLIEFLRDVGKHFTVNYMLAKDSVARRLEQEDGLSVTEFATRCCRRSTSPCSTTATACTLQIGGSDQWGNITAGMELIRRTRGRPAHGIVLPLVTTAGGHQVRQDGGGAVWLDPERTSPFRFYQFWLNTDDRDVERYLKWFTFLSARRDRGGDGGARGRTPPHAPPSGGWRRRSRAWCTATTGLARAERATGVLFGSMPAQELPAAELLDVFADVPSTELRAHARWKGRGSRVVDLLAEAGVAASKGEARRLIAGGGVSLNGERVDVARAARPRGRCHRRPGARCCGKGKKQNHVVRLV